MQTHWKSLFTRIPDAHAKSHGPPVESVKFRVHELLCESLLWLDGENSDMRIAARTKHQTRFHMQVVPDLATTAVLKWSVLSLSGMKYTDRYLRNPLKYTGARVAYCVESATLADIIVFEKAYHFPAKDRIVESNT